MPVPFLVPAAIALALYFLQSDEKAPGEPSKHKKNTKVKENKFVEITPRPIDDPANSVPDCGATKPENIVPAGGNDPPQPSES